MPFFHYKARDHHGKLVEGELEGVNRLTVKEALATQGFFPLTVSPRGWDLSFRTLFERRPSVKVLADLTRQFHALFAAGIPMDRIVRTLKRQTTHEGLAQALDRIHHDISSGLRLSEAFARHPRYFSNLYVAMLTVGEAGGVLEKTIKELSEILRKEHQLRSKLKSATLYPKFVLMAVVVVTALMLLFVLPAFSDFYAQYEATLPLPTRILILLSDGLVKWWYVVLIGAAGMVVGWKRWLRTPRGQDLMGAMAFRLPIFGNLHLMVANARFGHLVAALYRAGLPLTRALEIVADTAENIRYSQDIVGVRLALDQGSPLATAMAEARYFTPLMEESAAVGELTGKLDELLESTASFYDEEVDATVKNLTTLLEPALLFVVFGLIALLALAVYLPVWNLTKVVMPGG